MADLERYHSGALGAEGHMTVGECRQPHHNTVASTSRRNFYGASGRNLLCQFSRHRLETEFYTAKQ
jgi:hypothetical protein